MEVQGNYDMEFMTLKTPYMKFIVSLVKQNPRRNRKPVMLWIYTLYLFSDQKKYPIFMCMIDMLTYFNLMKDIFDG